MDKAYLQTLPLDSPDTDQVARVRALVFATGQWFSTSCATYVKAVGIITFNCYGTTFLCTLVLTTIPLGLAKSIAKDGLIS